MPLLVLFNSFWVEFHLSITNVGTAALCFIYALLFPFTFIFLPFTFHICMSFVNESYIQDIVGFMGDFTWGIFITGEFIVIVEVIVEIVLSYLKWWPLLLPLFSHFVAQGVLSLLPLNHTHCGKWDCITFVFIFMWLIL